MNNGKTQALYANSMCKICNYVFVSTENTHRLK